MAADAREYEIYLLLLAVILLSLNFIYIFFVYVLKVHRLFILMRNAIICELSISVPLVRNEVS